MFIIVELVLKKNRHILITLERNFGKKIRNVLTYKSNFHLLDTASKTPTHKANPDKRMYVYIFLLGKILVGIKCFPKCKSFLQRVDI